MTGYGRGVADVDGSRASIEIRSVNHRFMDVKLRGASLDPAIEEKVQARLRKSIGRGALTVTIKLDSQSRAAVSRIDLVAARRAHTALRELADSVGLEQEISLSLLCSQPGVMVATEADRSSEPLAASIHQAAEAALSELLAMREREGSTLQRDLTARLERLGELATTLEGLAKSAPDEAQKRLNDRLQRLLSNSKVTSDDARLAQEVALLSDRLDVTEEIVRVRSHLGQLADLMKTADKPIGRRMDFLVQELGREFNTVASKSQSAEIASTVVEAKAGLEKIREQVQNIE